MAGIPNILPQISSSRPKAQTPWRRQAGLPRRTGVQHIGDDAAGAHFHPDRIQQAGAVVGADREQVVLAALVRPQALLCAPFLALVIPRSVAASVGRRARDLGVREQVSVVDKVTLGRFGAALIRPGQVVILDGGTTALQVARHLAPGLRATVVTHSPTVAVELAAHPGIEVRLFNNFLLQAAGQPLIVPI